MIEDSQILTMNSSLNESKECESKGRVQNKKTENIMNLALFPFGPSLHP